MCSPAAFKQSAAFTRTNPKIARRHPRAGYKILDVTLAKTFSLTDRLRVEFKMGSYNVSNTFTAA